jgi:hypothetical protein
MPIDMYPQEGMYLFAYIDVVSYAFKQRCVLIYLFFGINSLVPGERSPGNPEFGHKVSKVWPRNVPPMNRTRLLSNDPS